MAKWSTYVLDWGMYPSSITYLARQLMMKGYRVRHEQHPLTKEERYSLCPSKGMITDKVGAPIKTASTVYELVPYMKLLAKGDADGFE